MMKIGIWYVRRNQTKRQNSVVGRGRVFNTHVFQQLVRQKLFRREVPGLYQIYSLRRMGFKLGEITLYRNGVQVRTGKINIEK